MKKKKRTYKKTDTRILKLVHFLKENSQETESIYLVKFTKKGFHTRGFEMDTEKLGIVSLLVQRHALRMLDDAEAPFQLIAQTKGASKRLVKSLGLK